MYIFKVSECVCFCKRCVHVKKWKRREGGKWRMEGQKGREFIIFVSKFFMPKYNPTVFIIGTYNN